MTAKPTAGDVGGEVREELRVGPCETCGATLRFYPDMVGLLPEEFSDDGRHASHHWRACELHAELRALRSAHDSTAPRLAALERVAEAAREAHRAISRLVDLSCATTIPHAMAIGRGAEFTLRLFVGEESVARFDAEPFIQDCASLMLLDEALSALAQDRKEGV